jgi:hypothetical protein
MPSWSYVPSSWAFDVASLMVLVGEEEERSYRLSQRSLVEAVTAAPVIGLQNYIRSYSFLLDGGSYSYFSPYGCKTALLRNARLDKIISMRRLVDDGRYTVYTISSSGDHQYPYVRIYQSLWVILTWICFGGILAFLFLVGDTTWIGFFNCIVLSGWSIVVRTTEHFFINPAEAKSVSEEKKRDAILILGRDNSAIVLEGTRTDIKNWTSRGLTYGLGSKSKAGSNEQSNSAQPANEAVESGSARQAREFELPTWAEICQLSTRSITFLILIFVFITIPNGTTMDQTAFLLLNVLGQVNVFVGRILNAWALFNKLEAKESTKGVQTRTHINANLIRHFAKASECATDWPDIAQLLPRTKVWVKWRARIVQGDNRDAKVIYDEIVEEEKKEERREEERREERSN